jgi:hypothetical protein
MFVLLLIYFLPGDAANADQFVVTTICHISLKHFAGDSAMADQFTPPSSPTSLDLSRWNSSRGLRTSILFLIFLVD